MLGSVHNHSCKAGVRLPRIYITSCIKVQSACNTCSRSMIVMQTYPAADGYTSTEAHRLCMEVMCSADEGIT